MTDMNMRPLPARSFSRLFRASPRNVAHVVAFLLLAAIAVLIARGLVDVDQPLPRPSVQPITLDPGNLPNYALRTTPRMFVALADDRSNLDDAA